MHLSGGGSFHKDRLFHDRTDLEWASLPGIQYERQRLLLTFADANATSHALFIEYAVHAIHHFEGLELTLRGAITTPDA
jgi:hypothetical protein